MGFELAAVTRLWHSFNIPLFSGDPDGSSSPSSLELTMKSTRTLASLMGLALLLAAGHATAQDNRGELITNGTFENGTNGWTSATLDKVVGSWQQQQAYAGSRYAWLCGYGKATKQHLYQRVSIPAGGSASLSFYLHIDTAESGSAAKDKLNVYVVDADGNVLRTLATYTNANAGYGFTKRSFDMNAFRGQTVYIYFEGAEDASKQTSFVIDNVSLSSSGSGNQDNGNDNGNTGSTQKTFYTTSVQDDLDNQDKRIFASNFQNMGWRSLGDNGNVSASALNSLLGRNDIGILYHTGHGLETGIATAGNSLLYTNNVSTVRVNHFISATCLTLTPRTWTSKMASSCQTVNGYTKVSFDPLDNQQVVKYASAVKAGQSFPMAWYTSNVAFSQLSDRWCCYARTSSGIVEYSARTYNKPRAAAAKETLLAGNGTTQLFLSEAFDNQVEAKRGHAFPAGVFSTQVESESKAGDLFMQGQEENIGLMRNAMTQEDALEAAQAWARENMAGQEVALDKVVGVEAQLNDASATTGYVVRFVRSVGELPVRCNGQDDFVAVTVQGGAVTGYTKSWTKMTNINLQASCEGLMEPMAALQKAANVILRNLKGGIHLTGVKNCLGRKGQQLVPAYEFMDASGASIILGAQDAAFLQ